jgi:hypothetical protein
MLLTTVDFNPTMDFGFFHLRKLGYPASLGDIDGSTLVLVYS